MSEIRTSEPVARWMLGEALRDPARAFNFHPPHECKLCDERTEPRAWRRHLTEHRAELARLEKARRRAATANLRTVNRLRRETRTL